MPFDSLIIVIRSCWVLQVSKIWCSVDVVWIFVAVLVANFILLWNPSHLYDWHWTNWTRKSRCCLLSRCKVLLVFRLCCVDGWFIHQIAYLCLIRINLWRLDFMCGLKCLYCPFGLSCTCAFNGLGICPPIIFCIFFPFLLIIYMSTRHKFRV